MTIHTDPKLKKFTDYLGLQIKYSTDLSDDVPGFLKFDSEPPYIVLNANKPRTDHALTIGHEIAHYVMHENRPRKFGLPWFVNYPWKWKWASQVAAEAKAYLLEKFDREWEADVWAFVFLLTIGAYGDLMAVFKMYPEKRWILFTAMVAMAYAYQKQPGRMFFRRVSLMLSGRTNKNLWPGFFPPQDWQ